MYDVPLPDHAESLRDGRRPVSRDTVTDAIPISASGSFEIDGHAYRIPESFSQRQVLGYRSLLAPVPDKARGTVLTPEQRHVTETYLFRRAAACVIPGFGLHAPETLTWAQLGTIHQWIGRYRPALALDGWMAQPRTDAAPDGGPTKEKGRERER